MPRQIIDIPFRSKTSRRRPARLRPEIDYLDTRRRRPKSVNSFPA